MVPFLETDIWSQVLPLCQRGNRTPYSVWSVETKR